MIRSTLVLCAALTLLAVVAPASPVFAQPASLENGSDQLAQSRKALLEARQRVAEARKEVSDAEFAYRKWSQRRRPRGVAKAEMLERLDKAHVELEKAEAALPGAMEDARRAGLPPGEFRELEAEQPL